jgi:hypothetical protein
MKADGPCSRSHSQGDDLDAVLVRNQHNALNARIGTVPGITAALVDSVRRTRRRSWGRECGDSSRARRGTRVAHSYPLA